MFRYWAGSVLIMPFIVAYFNKLFLFPLSPHPHVILHEGFTRSCRIHCFQKRQNLLPWGRRCPKGGWGGGRKRHFRDTPWSFPKPFQFFEARHDSRTVKPGCLNFQEIPFVSGHISPWANAGSHPVPLISASHGNKNLKCKVEWGTAFGIFSLPNGDFLDTSKDVVLLWFVLDEFPGKRISVIGEPWKGIQVNT